MSIFRFLDEKANGEKDNTGVALECNLGSDDICI